MKHLYSIITILFIIVFTHPIAAQKYPDWMSQSKDKIENMSLMELAIPASHDAGTYTLEPKIAPDVVPYLRMLFQSGIPVVIPWAQTQELSIYEQLNRGIRYLDLRICMDGDEIKFCHSFYGDSYKNIFSQIENFLDKNNDEIIILGFNHFWDFAFQRQNGFSIDNAEEGLTTEHLTDLLQLINKHFKGRIVPFDEEISPGKVFTSQSTLKEIWDDKKSKNENQVILLFNQNNFNGVKTKGLVKDRIDFWWNQESYTYFDEQDKNKFLKKTDNKLAKTHEKFYAIRSCVTPSNGMYASILDVGGTYPNNLKELAEDTNPVVLDHLQKSKYKKNLIWADYINKTDLVELALYLNNIMMCKNSKGKVKAINPTFNKSKSNWGNWKSSLDLFAKYNLMAINTGKDYIIDGANAAVEWTEDLFSNKKVKANPPKNGIPVNIVDENISHYRVTLDKIKVINTGNDDVTGTKELEIFGAINVFPQGNLYANHGANKYLWHKSSDQKKSLQKNKSVKPKIYKDFYGLETQKAANLLLIKVNLKEHDESRGDDKLKGQKLISLANFSDKTKTQYEVLVKDGSQKCKVFFTIEKI